MRSAQSFVVGSGKHAKEKSVALVQALTHVKDFMTDAQKALVLHREGKIALDAGDFRGALECFSQGVVYNPTVGLFNLRAICHKQLEMFNEAYFDYSYNIRLEPENGVHYCNRGLCLAKLKKFSLAIEDLNQAIECEPTASNYYARACVYADFGRFTNAVADYGAALNDDPANLTLEFQIKCKYRRALAYFDIQQMEQAIKDATEVLQLDATNVNARSLLGKAYKVIHEYQKAEDHLTNAILIENDQAGLYAERGDIRFRTGQQNKLVEAVYDFDVAVKLLELRLGASKDVVGLCSLLGISSAGARLVGKSSPHVTTSATVTITQQQGSSKSKKAISFAAGTNTASGAGNGSGDEPGTSRSQEEEAFWRGLDTEGGDDDDLRRQDSSSVSPDTFAARGRSPSSRQLTSGSSKGVITIQALPQTSAARRDLEEQLAESLYKRAQAKMLLPSQDSVVIESALADAWKAIQYQEDDDDFHLLAGSCLIRLQRYHEAVEILEHVLQRSPQNLKALYNLSFCRRAEGYQKDAIEGLTKIINATQSTGTSWAQMMQGAESAASPADGSKSSAPAAMFPIHRVYEMRGTLFHEAQAHKLALLDLGKAIAINPGHAENYFLRADCHCKLGDYEQAVQDYDQAERKGFPDRSSLLLARGNVKRLLQDQAGAVQDYQLGLDLIQGGDDLVGQVRARSFIAFCHIDLRNFTQAQSVLNAAVPACANLVKVHEAELIALKNPTSLEGTMRGCDTMTAEARRLRFATVEAEFLYCERMVWLLQYHIMLCEYMQHRFAEASVIALDCMSETRARFIPDDFTKGILHFFTGQIHLRLHNYDDALQSFCACAETSWVRMQRQELLCAFAIAKTHQALGRHREALPFFNRACDLDKENPFVYFRRAWSHKALQNYVQAGDDFESAKNFGRNNPNFAVDYKRIGKVEFMEIADEPDFVEPLPALLPVPGMNMGS